MGNRECIELLQWMLPILGLRWAGFRRVRKQVCKRITRRMRELGLESADDYRLYLTSHDGEWAVADTLCRITISRFYRGKGVFAFLESDVVPALAAEAIETGRDHLWAWSSGCGSGEEPYTLALLWELGLRDRLPGLNLRILGTDVDAVLLRRAAEARYPPGCLKDLPAEWLAVAFEAVDGGYALKARYRDAVRFELHDVRTDPAWGPFDLILCRSLAFTYFNARLQTETAARLERSLRTGGALVLGSHERLPPETDGYSLWSKQYHVYRKDGG